MKRTRTIETTTSNSGNGVRIINSNRDYLTSNISRHFNIKPNRKYKVTIEQKKGGEYRFSGAKYPDLLLKGDDSVGYVCKKRLLEYFPFIDGRRRYSITAKKVKG